jgi:hypothetical protein
MGSINPRWFFGAVAPSIFGDGTAYGNISGTASYDSGTGTWTVTGAATVDIDGGTSTAVLRCKKIVVDGASAVLSVSTNCKGLLLFASVSVEVKNGGKINIDKKGKAGNFGDLTLWSLVPAAMQSGLKQSALEAYALLGEGAAAQGSNNTDLTVRTGNAASSMQTGGGGEGTGYGSPGGGNGGPCCGGAGGPGDSYTSGNALGATAIAPGAYGGPGGSANVTALYTSGGAGGGAGDPVGTGYARSGSVSAPDGAGGGVVWLFSPSISVASGCSVTSSGAHGGNASNTGGGGAGGGNVGIVTQSGGLSNSGTISAPGGAGGTGTRAGSAGGAGSVNTSTV